MVARRYGDVLCFPLFHAVEERARAANDNGHANNNPHNFAAGPDFWMLLMLAERWKNHRYSNQHAEAAQDYE